MWLFVIYNVIICMTDCAYCLLRPCSRFKLVIHLLTCNCLKSVSIFSFKDPGLFQNFPFSKIMKQGTSDRSTRISRDYAILNVTFQMNSLIWATYIYRVSSSNISTTLQAGMLNLEVTQSGDHPLIRLQKWPFWHHCLHVIWLIDSASTGGVKNGLKPRCLV